ncbi:MAG: SUMF1/EgtB/PvdO family nonheme iron enzyme, partial [bacterium]|nr:SUMF1/EgtB/PvdO family nonheme iron enzyme [bacterium]
PVNKYDKGISPYGCYNMAGNVSEWCSDWYDMEYYLSTANNNPKGPDIAKEKRIVRGGNWDNTMYDCKTSERNSEQPEKISDKIGFRVAK